MLGRTEMIPVYDGERRMDRPVRLRVHPGDALGAARVRHRVPHARRARSCTAATSSSTSRRSTAARPISRSSARSRSAAAAIKLLLSDSTNAEKPGFTPSETTVGVSMRNVFRDFPDRRFIVASFASHLHRVQQVTRRGAQRRAQGRLPRPVDGAERRARPRDGFPRPRRPTASSTSKRCRATRRARCASICTGSQGEPMSALSLMAAHEHKYIKVSDDDVVVISAHAIPGNESNVSRVIDSLHRAGAEVIHDRIAPVHVSGHASQEELKFLIDLVQPEWFVPVHGEYRHLVHHARLAEAVGVAPGHVLVCEDGDVLTTRRRPASTSNGARFPPATSTSTASSATSASACSATGATSPRKGSWSVIVTVDAVTGELVTGPEIVTRGWVYAPEAEELLEEAKAAVRESLARGRRRGRHRLRDPPPPRPPLARQVHQRAHPPPPRHHPGGHRGLIGEPRSARGVIGIDPLHQLEGDAFGAFEEAQPPADVVHLLAQHGDAVGLEMGRDGGDVVHPERKVVVPASPQVRRVLAGIVRRDRDRTRAAGSRSTGRIPRARA